MVKMDAKPVGGIDFDRKFFVNENSALSSFAERGLTWVSFRPGRW
jgi:hypothetical protein